MRPQPPGPRGAGRAEVVKALHGVGVHLNAHGVSGDGVVLSALALPGLSQVIVGPVLLRVETNRLLVRGDGLDHAALLHQRVTPVEVGCPEARSQFNRLVERGQRGIELFAEKPGIPQSAVDCCDLLREVKGTTASGVVDDRPFKGGDRLIHLAAAPEGETEEEMGFGLVGVEFNSFCKSCLGLRKSPFLWRPMPRLVYNSASPTGSVSGDRSMALRTQDGPISPASEEQVTEVE